MNNLEYWQNLAVDAQAGDLSVEPGVAVAANTACEKYVGELDAVLKRVHLLKLNGAMGQFPSGIQLEEKFTRLAMGGERSLENVLIEHIAIIQAMQAFFRRFFADVTDQDAENATLIGNVENR